MEHYLNKETTIIDPIAVTEEYMLHYGKEVKMYIYQYVKNVQAADDLTQDAFTKFYEKLHTYKGQSSLKTWLYQIAKNCARDYLRSWYFKNVAVHETFADNLYSRSTVEQQVLTNEGDAEMLAAIDKLTDKQQEVIHLYYYGELKTAEIAEVLGVNENTIKTRLRDAKRKLRDILGDDEDGQY